MIKYLGSKRRLVPVLGDLLTPGRGGDGAGPVHRHDPGGPGVETAGRLGLGRRPGPLRGGPGRCYIETDADDIDHGELDDALSHLQHLPGEDGYVTETFSRAARYFQAHNGRRIDAIRDEIERRWAGHRLRPMLLTSLLEAADRVDSTTGLQMAYLKQWSPRSYQPLELRLPGCWPGPGRPARATPSRWSAACPRWTWPTSTRRTTSTGTSPTTTCGRPWWRGTPPTTTAWRASGSTPGSLDHERVQRPPAAPDALAQVIAACGPRWWWCPGSDEGWVDLDDLVDMAGRRGEVEVLAFDSKRYVGAQIGIHNPRGEKGGPGGPHPQHGVPRRGGPAQVAHLVAPAGPVLARAGRAAISR